MPGRVPGIRRIRRTPILILLLVGASACDPYRQLERRNRLPEGRITHVLMVLDEAGTERSYFVDPTMVDAVFLSAAAREQFYAGSGGPPRDLRPGDVRTRPIDLGPLGESGGGRHLKSPPEWHCAYLTDVINRLGLYFQLADGRTELWWADPARVGAVFLDAAARAQFYGGTRIESREAVGAPASLLPMSGPVPPIPGGASLHLN